MRVLNHERHEKHENFVSFRAFRCKNIIVRVRSLTTMTGHSASTRIADARSRSCSFDLMLPAAGNDQIDFEFRASFKMT